MAVALLTSRALRLRFGGVEAAAGVDLDVHEHEFLAIIGQNGAGKSTFLNICTGYLKPDAGEVHFAGRPITGLAPRAINRAGIARAFQHPQLFDSHILLDNLRFAVSTRRGFWRPWPALDQPGFDDEARALLALLRLDDWGHEIVAETSEGVRKLLDIAMALALRPRLLLMDEPTSGVSADEKHGIMATLVSALRERRVAAVFVEHDMDVVRRYADRVAVWVEGRIVALGPPETVLADPAVREQV